MQWQIAVPATLALVIYAYLRKSLTPLGIVAAAGTAAVHAYHPWNLPFTLLCTFFLAGTLATKVRGSPPPVLCYAGFYFGPSCRFRFRGIMPDTRLGRSSMGTRRPLPCSPRALSARVLAPIRKVRRVSFPLASTLLNLSRWLPPVSWVVIRPDIGRRTRRRHPTIMRVASSHLVMF